MIIVISSHDKKKVVEGKRYIGTGTYKDKSGFVWTLKKIDNNWLIERVAAKSLNDKAAKDYWSKIFTKEMVSALFKRKTVAKKIESNLDSDSEVAKYYFDIVGEDEIIKCVATISKDEDKYSIGISSGDESKEIRLPEKVAIILDSFDREASVNLLIDMLSSKEFGNFILSAFAIDEVS